MGKRFLRFVEVLLGAVLLTVSVPVAVQAMTDSESAVAAEEAVAGTGGVAINATNFPDNEFRYFISHSIDKLDYYSGRQDGILSAEEISEVETICVRYGDIKDLTGIQFFSALEYLECQGNQLTTLDVSGCTALKNLVCGDNQLKTLKTSGCTTLEELNCNGNQLTKLDVSSCSALKELVCSNNQLTTLKVSDCSALEKLYCSDNQLTTLEVNDCSTLKLLECSNNQLKTLNTSGCTSLEFLACDANKITRLDLSDCRALKYLSCTINQLTELKLSDSDSLDCVYCYENQLMTLDLSKNESISNIILNGTIVAARNNKGFQVQDEGMWIKLWADNSVETRLSDGSVLGPFLSEATLKAKNITANASPSKAQSFKISYTYDGDGKVSFKSNNAKVTVNADGKVTVPKNYAGKATITISAPATKQFQAASTTITVTVKHIANRSRQMR